MYGCIPAERRWAGGDKAAKATRNLPRVLPMIMSKNFEPFTYEGCDFKVSMVCWWLVLIRLNHNVLLVVVVLLKQMQASKASTARIVGFSELGIVHAFTLEASLCGFRDRHFRTIGMSCNCMCLSLYQPPQVSIFLHSRLQISSSRVTASASR